MAEHSLSATAADAVVNAEEVLVTPIARSEIGIKLAIGKLSLPVTEDRFWREIVRRLQAREIPYDCSHASLLSKMPLHHRDPFDRMIAAQCLVEEVWLATTDEIFNAYGVKTVL